MGLARTTNHGEHHRLTMANKQHDENDAPTRLAPELMCLLSKGANIDHVFRAELQSSSIHR